MYPDRRGSESMLPTGTYHFFMLSRGVWPFCKIIKRSRPQKEETNRFEANLLERTAVSVTVFRAGLCKTGALKLYRFHFMGQVSHFAAYWRNNRQSPRCNILGNSYSAIEDLTVWVIMCSRPSKIDVEWLKPWDEFHREKVHWAYRRHWHLFNILLI